MPLPAEEERDRLRKKRGLAEVMGEKVRKGGQLQRDSHRPLHELLPPPQTLRGRCVPDRASTAKDDAREIQSLAEGKAREEAYELRKELALWASLRQWGGAHLARPLCSLPKRHRFCLNLRGAAVIPTLSRGHAPPREAIPKVGRPGRLALPGFSFSRAPQELETQLPWM